MTRITNSMMTSNYLRNVSKNLNNVQKLQNQLSTGKEISKPSDDPFKASRIVKMYADIGSNEQYNDNITDVSNFLDVTDSSYEQLGNVFGRVRELLVSAGNAAYGSDQMKAIQDEMKVKVTQISQIMNNNFDGKYVFGGSKVDSKPTVVEDGKLYYANSKGQSIKDPVYTDAAGNITEDPAAGTAVSLKDVNLGDLETQLEAAKNAGDTARVEELEKIKLNITEKKQLDAELKVEVSQGVTINYNQTATGTLSFTDPDDPTRTINVADVMNDIINNLGDPDGKDKLTGENLKDLDKTIDHLLSKRSAVGAMQNRMESASKQNETENYNMTNILANTEQIDFTETMIDFASLMTVYKASLQISSNILPQTIMDYI